LKFTIDDKDLIKWMQLKKLHRKTLAQDVFFLTEAILAILILFISYFV